MAAQLAGASEPDEVSRGLAALERYVAEQAPLRSTPPPATGAGQAAGNAEAGAVPAGSRRVRRLRAEVTQAHALLGLQADPAPLWVDSARVRRRRRAVLEAARLHELSRAPAAQAWQAGRWRRVVTVAAMTALVLALGWSTAGVQHFAAGGAPAGSPAWWAAWCVEPLISLALLSVVGAKAYFASRGQPLTNPTLTRVEWGFLLITVTMNVWPYLPWVAAQFTFSGLLIHTIGPVVAVSVVTALPIIWQHFVTLDTDPASRAYSAPHAAPTAAGYRTNAPAWDTAAGPGVAAVAPVDPRLLDRAWTLIRQGRLPRFPSATQLRTALDCGTSTARRLRDHLNTEPRYDAE